MKLKECNLDCEFSHEGYCIADTQIKGFNPFECTAKTDKDLISEEEFDEIIKKLWNDC